MSTNGIYRHMTNLQMQSAGWKIQYESMEAFRNRGCDIAVYRSGKRSLVIRWTLLELFFLFYNPDSDQ